MDWEDDGGDDGGPMMRRGEGGGDAGGDGDQDFEDAFSDDDGLIEFDQADEAENKELEARLSFSFAPRSLSDLSPSIRNASSGSSEQATPVSLMRLPRTTTISLATRRSRKMVKRSKRSSRRRTATTTATMTTTTIPMRLRCGASYPA